MRPVGQRPGGGARAGAAVLRHSAHPLHHLGHGFQFNGRTVHQPQAPAFQVVDEFVSTQKTANPFLGLRLFGQQFGALSGGQQQVTAIIGHGAKNDLGHRADRCAPLVDQHVGSFDQIGVDVAHIGNHWFRLNGFIVGQRYALGLVHAKADDHAVHRRTARRIIGPLKSAVRKLDVHTHAQHWAPQRRHLLALGDAVGGDKTATHFAPCQGLHPVHVGKQVAKAGGRAAKLHVLELLAVAAGR